MKISNLLFGANIKIPEHQKDGTYQFADYTLGFFGAGVAAFIRKDIHSLCRFGDSTSYVGSDLDKSMTEIYDSYPDELKEMIIPCTFSLYNGDDTISITRKVFVPTLTMVGGGDNREIEKGLTWPIIFAGRNNRKKTFNGFAADWWLSSRSPSDGAWFVYADGSTDYDYRPSGTRGVVPAFIIPQSAQIDDTTDNDDSYRVQSLLCYYIH